MCHFQGGSLTSLRQKWMRLSRSLSSQRSSQPSLGSALAPSFSKGFQLLVRLSGVLNELRP